jgi:hypothetical protein
VALYPLSFSPKGRAERLKIALQAILAKAPDCREGHRSNWLLPKISQRADFLTVGPPWGKARMGVLYELRKNNSFNLKTCYMNSEEIPSYREGSKPLHLKQFPSELPQYR